MAEARIGTAGRRATRCCMMTIALAATAAGRASAQTQSTGSYPAPGAWVDPHHARECPRQPIPARAGQPGRRRWVVGGAVLERLRHEDRTDLAEQIASRATQRVAEVSVRHGLAAAMHLSTDDHYQFCECHGFGPRVGHALVASFTDSRADGSRALAVPRIAGSYAAGFTGLAWDHDRSVGNVLAGTALSFGLHALFNIGRELTGIGR